MFVRSKKAPRSPETYYSVLTTYRDGPRIRHRHVVALGRHDTVESALAAARHELGGLESDRRYLSFRELLPLQFEQVLRIPNTPRVGPRIVGPLHVPSCVFGACDSNAGLPMPRVPFDPVPFDLFLRHPHAGTVTPRQTAQEASK